ncbi:uncharacterized protein LAJ45_09466 [Morchella importuna]|uniref:uncharacterized protein n=1 Tax=Morchella importuna TaxID=1174673 RepID=UPI001E8EE5EC|nr:uncharacterized protein LAJ45_09466 [Morchella importuna]KAH8146520.1 hypothetical protein LAJ45_09466 [Morchella importuna]
MFEGSHTWTNPTDDVLESHRRMARREYVAAPQTTTDGQKNALMNHSTNRSETPPTARITVAINLCRLSHDFIFPLG